MTLLAAPDLATLATSLDTVWVLVAAFLVFWMQAGFALVEAGFTRSKNTGNIVMKNLMDFAVGSVVYWALGFALMFGVGKWIGTSGFFLSDNFSHLGLNLPLPAFFMFQLVFAGTAATIVSGAMAERTRFKSYLVYSAVISALIYPVVGKLVWGGGWLASLGFIDFAGSTVVHSVGGWAALMGAVVLGPRIGKYNKDGSANPIPGHNLLIVTLGVFILWLGWFGFNPGSTLSALTPMIATVAFNTNMAAAAGALAAMAFVYIRHRYFDVSMTLNGVLAGLVGVTAGAAAVDTIGSLSIGLICGVAVVLFVELLEKAHVDDPVGAVPVHLGCGVLGTLLVGLFATEGGLLYGGGFRLLGTQIIGVLTVAAWTIPTTAALFLGLKHTIGLRVSAEDEITGLDLVEHGTSAYGEAAALYAASTAQLEIREGAGATVMRRGALAANALANRPLL